jgi:hypothetical protein
MTIEKSSLTTLMSLNITPPSLLGVWTNEMNSTMTVTSVNGANFAGAYESDDGQGGRIKGILSGITSGETLGWTVSWKPKLDATTSWAGKFLVDKVTKKYVIYTLWHLSSGDEDVPLWESFLAGQDLFWQ